MVTTADTLKMTDMQTISADSGLYIGVDNGGTKVAAGIVNQMGEIHKTTKSPMSTHGPGAEGPT